MKRQTAIIMATVAALFCAAASFAAEELSKQESDVARRDAMINSLFEAGSAPVASKEELNKTADCRMPETEASQIDVAKEIGKFRASGQQHTELIADNEAVKDEQQAGGKAISGFYGALVRQYSGVGSSKTKAKDERQKTKDSTAGKAITNDQIPNTKYQLWRGFATIWSKGGGKSVNRQQNLANETTDAETKTLTEVQFGAGYDRAVIENIVARVAKNGVENTYVAEAQDKRGRTFYRARAGVKSYSEADKLCAKLSRMGLKNYIVR